MVAEAIKSALGSVYELRSFRSRDALGALVGRARKALAREFDRELAGLGLNTAQALVLVLLADGITCTAADIGRELSHDPGAMTRIVDKLEDSGYVRRVPRERDRRASDLELTAAGRRAPGGVRGVQVPGVKRVLRGLSRTAGRPRGRPAKRLPRQPQGAGR